MKVSGNGMCVMTGQRDMIPGKQPLDIRFGVSTVSPSSFFTTAIKRTGSGVMKVSVLAVASHTSSAGGLGTGVVHTAENAGTPISSGHVSSQSSSCLMSPML